MIQSMAMYINMHAWGDTCILGTQVDNDNAYNTGKKQCLLMYCVYHLIEPQLPHVIYVLSFLCQNLFEDSVFLKLWKKTLFHV